jgi:hypothetical protein
MPKLPNTPIDRSKAVLKPLDERPSKANHKNFSSLPEGDKPLTSFLDSLPRIFKGNEFRELLRDAAQAVQNDRAVFVGMGAHVIKVGIGPLLIDCMKKDLVAGLTFHGACCIHDLEIAMIGQTSEDVGAGLADGSFGMVRETGHHFFAALQNPEPGRGLGWHLGRYICEQDFPYRRYSLLGNAYELDKPVTVHVGLGTDIVHQHPEADGALLGELSYLDFEILANNLQAMHDGGGFLNLGSAVLVPEVFLKALTVCRNITGRPHDFFTANFDQIEHYRPRVNIVNRPTQDSRLRGYHFTGHHEIMLPLFLQLWKEALNLG